MVATYAQCMLLLVFQNCFVTIEKTTLNIISELSDPTLYVITMEHKIAGGYNSFASSSLRLGDSKDCEFSLKLFSLHHWSLVRQCTTITY